MQCSSASLTASLTASFETLDVHPTVPRPACGAPPFPLCQKPQPLIIALDETWFQRYLESQCHSSHLLDHELLQRPNRLTVANATNPGITKELGWTFANVTNGLKTYG